MTDLSPSAALTLSEDTAAHPGRRNLSTVPKVDAPPETEGRQVQRPHGLQRHLQDQPGFRSELRRATRPEHDTAELAFAPFHQRPLPHLAWFLACQHTALHALADTCRLERGRATALLADLTAALRADCADNGDRPAAISADTLPQLHPLAVDYLVLGSRMGNEVLRRRLSEAAGQMALPAYFAPRDHLATWRATCTDLEQLPPKSALAQRIVADTRKGFDLFETAARLNPLKTPTI
ncbi:heme oxygenase-like domain-containing protein [Phaeobacter gallaeciensis]|uniref:Heme oxygenase n=1 Tax=Phaeobacter gallaeciensis TaxID=60890 RepID=A0AAD0EBR7_9RHOB|nr:hypothetical protein [Phaeobacter gallaeciensis]AHD08354.1 hypothetical protein Gal_00562 [Phaeobacter gallaeciensis DSM 26640]ATE91620.1 Heme oxygenase [Phaeobacter gallaeciensis]ATE95896.1 Heme oxygenase [Phaeobacter gallaeciensis]ATF00236.1 Heme oxygenase [Phaeobacter gallaeciensis]ATF04668.1 Heme oxygenase [Phaeobacter gallaeciensis]